MAYVPPIPIRAVAAASKIEVTYGLDPIPTSVANAVRLARSPWESGCLPTMQWANLRDDVVNFNFIPLPAAGAQGQKVILSMQWELKGLGSIYSAGAFVDVDPMIQACGYQSQFAPIVTAWVANTAYVVGQMVKDANGNLERVTVAGTSGGSTPTWQTVYGNNTTDNTVTWQNLGAAYYLYTPITPAVTRPSCTVYFWGNGNQYKASGCRGNFEIRFPGGERCIVTFTMEGFLNAMPVAASVPASTYTGVVPGAAVSQQCAIGPWTPDYNEIIYRTGNRLEWLVSGNAVTGLQSYDYGVSMPEIEIDGRSVPAGTYEPITDWLNATSRTWSATVGSTQFNKVIVQDSTGIWIPQQWQPYSDKGQSAWRARYRAAAPQILFV